MKKLLLVLLLGFAQPTKAAELQFTLAAGINSILTNAPTRVTELVLTTGASAATVFLYDSTAGTLTNLVLAAYPSRSSYVTNVITSFTDELGNVSSKTNAGIFTLTSTVAASTNEFSRVASFYAPANSTTVKTVDLRLVRGVVTAHSSAVATLTMTYR